MHCVTVYGEVLWSTLKDVHHIGVAYTYVQNLFFAILHALLITSFVYFLLIHTYIHNGAIKKYLFITYSRVRRSENLKDEVVENEIQGTIIAHDDNITLWSSFLRS
jgi:hypothetical protein